MADSAATGVQARDITEGLFAFIDQEVMPLQRDLAPFFDNPRKYWREDGRVAEEVDQARRVVRTVSAKAGYYMAFLPEELGGTGLGARLHLETWTALWYRHGPHVEQLPYVVFAHPATGPTRLWLHASDSLKRDVLPRLASGELQGAFAMSEPDAGSDAWMMATRAIRDGDDWVITGQKQWASWAPTADYVLVFAVTDPERYAKRRGGLTCFYVPTDTPGYRCESVIKLFGELGGEECILSFTEVRVPDQYRIGPVDEAFSVAMEGSDSISLTKTAQTIATAHWALDRATEYARNRRTFGQAVIDHQMVQRMLAESAVEIYASKLMAFDCASKIDAGVSIRSELPMTSAFVWEAMYRVIDRAIQVHGGMGMANEMQLMHALHWARVARITEGPTEIQLRSVANQIIKGRLQL